mmetsp:Transcript_25644/g.57516  ORF Transcript_25644/g.57516 Transcript_25644/m.57516 type:complete len:111 (+) Transcript_25644:84-416(+)|eukprot:CAMPEP_0172608860 /NCGR_PEP_ID=MMETSP1068-20121228/28914_1 /TAXON_ID=35684 /ORGANISM="Pseudopedinella elastica, Strain CCMP716" /LENGTH=110 /DNA_ID=CAMNT_0013412241 /DNA_START=33 /DNA_END=365 /DNA_ORIENTATION=-
MIRLLLVSLLSVVVSAWAPANSAHHSLRRDFVKVHGLFDDLKSMGGLDEGNKEAGTLSPGEMRSAKRKAAKEAAAIAAGGTAADAGEGSMSAEEKIEKLKAELARGLDGK